MIDGIGTRGLYEILLDLSDEMDKWAKAIEGVAPSHWADHITSDMRRVSGELRQRCLADAAKNLSSSRERMPQYIDIQAKGTPVAKSFRIHDLVVLDVDEAGEVVGIEIL